MVPEKLGSFRARLPEAGVFLDFDGTLSEIVDVPDEARPFTGVPEVLESLSEVAALVAIVSGRSAHQLVDWLGNGIEIWGVHGAEIARDGRVELSRAAAAVVEVMGRAKGELRLALEALGDPAITFEDKGVVANAHFRRAERPDAAEIAIREVMQPIADRHGLSIGRGRMTLELKPRADFSKERVVRERTVEEGLGAAAFVGDDTVDLPAFDALDELESEGVATLRVAVRSEEADPELLRRADLIVDGPSGAVGFLRDLALTRDR